MITAKLNNYRQSPRKVRLIANLVKGKRVDNALDILDFAVKRASLPLKGLIESAIANAKNNFNLDKESLFIKEFRVDGGAILYRRMPRARGTAYPIRKRTSHVFLELEPREAKEAKTAKSKKEKIAKKEEKKEDKAGDIK
ncbi:MAG: 50S ribosomal protein L22 [Patescibacteria group bacterium]|nr:50S ribosomal protein L22 [Patescibacteria group bacterium]MDE1988786.1 50S ribosomal protein L22 [Patescibacteria group bacterium]MDE2217894.1 50S ribosomal protein L22 [Patescibacteria group bacterium]